MEYIYYPKNVCSTEMKFVIENNVMKNIEIKNGCPGNLLGISKLCIGKNIDEIINTLSGIKCRTKDTSCPDQIASALIEYKKEYNN